MAIKSEWVFDVTEADFEEKVLKKSQDVPVVVDFWAPWCGPCRSLGPILEGMIDQRAGKALLAKVNTDEQQGLAAQYGINALPTVVAFRKGRAVLSFEGVLPEAQLTDFFNRLEPTEAEKSAETAATLEKTDPAKAEEMYRLALKNNPDQEDAMVGLARLLVDQKNNEEANDLIERIGPGGEFGAEAEKLRAILWLADRAKDFPDGEALRKKVKTNPKDAQSQYELGCVLAADGKTTESLETLYQAGMLDRKLATAKVRETMVKIFFVIGVRSDLADAYRDKLTSMLY
ncbi:MAG: thioredoxin [Gemmataceae bacterium]|nr:thioredoxin [Gemmataceae bacterium]